MPFHNVSVILGAPRDRVYGFLANIENVPRWATRTCESLRILRGRWYALTSRGELVMQLEADDASGSIDLLAGPSPGCLTPLPIRVTALSRESTLVQMTFIQAPDQSSERFAQEWQDRLEELRGLCTRFGGGVVHATPAPGPFSGAGLN